MKECNLNGIRTDLASEIKNNKKQILYTSIENDINVSEIINKENIYRIIEFSNINNTELIKEFLIKEISFFIKKKFNNKDFHAFVIGLGNENNTADSIGPKVLKNIKVNSYLESLNIPIIGNKVSTLEPGVLGQTGIETKKIIESVSKEINPECLILIDSYVTESFDYLNKSIQITDEGIIPGSGLYNYNDEISKKTMGIPVIVIGIPTAIEVNFISKENTKYPCIVSTKDIDSYVVKISKIISYALNEVLFNH